MQAIFIFVMYGFFYAVIIGFVNIGALDALDLKEQQVRATKELFHNIDLVVNQDIIPREMTVPNFGTNVRNYLNYINIRKKINWSHSANFTQDPWGTNFTGYVLTKRTAIASQSGGGYVHVPVTAFALVSAGPDKTLANSTQSAINSLSSSSDLRAVTRIAAEVGTDDIVYTFTTYDAQIRHWQRILGTVYQVSEGIGRIFNAQFSGFLSDLKSVYSTGYTDFLNYNGQIVLNSSAVARWAADGVTAPLPSMRTLENALDTYFYKEKTFIEDNNLILRLKSYTTPGGPPNPQCLGASGPTRSHMMRLCLSNNGSPWGDSRGRLFYYVDIEGEQIYE